MPDFDAIKSIRNFKSLVKYLRTKLDWPIDENMADDLTFDYSPDELGLAEDVAVKIREIKQVRPLVEGQAWGAFFGLTLNPSGCRLSQCAAFCPNLCARNAVDVRRNKPCGT
jgi:hypothetical protein